MVQFVPLGLDRLYEFVHPFLVQLGSSGHDLLLPGVVMVGAGVFLVRCREALGVKNAASMRPSAVRSRGWNPGGFRRRGLTLYP